MTTSRGLIALITVAAACAAEGNELEQTGRLDQPEAQASSAPAATMPVVHVWKSPT